MSEETSSEVIEETAVVEEAAAALGDTELSEEEAALAAYKPRLRTYILVKRKLLPGYVLVRMDINDRSWSVVRDTPGVTSFVGNEGHPTPVKHRDVAKFLMPPETAAETSEAEKAVVADGEKVVASPTPSTANTIEVDYQVDEVVTILTGPFASISATISEIDAQGGKLTGMISFMGREMPVELTFDQVEKIN